MGWVNMLKFEESKFAFSIIEVLEVERGDACNEANGRLYDIEGAGEPRWDLASAACPAEKLRLREVWEGYGDERYE